jgi:hypothetical protein
MMDQNTDWLIEFVHDYDDSYFVTKRGLDATPVVGKKFDLAVDEVMALTAFYFHPDFPLKDRPVPRLPGAGGTCYTKRAPGVHGRGRVWPALDPQDA